MGNVQNEAFQQRRKQEKGGEKWNLQENPSISVMIPAVQVFKVHSVNGDYHTQNLYSEAVNIYTKLKLHVLKFCSTDSVIPALYQSIKRNNSCQNKFTA